MIKLIASDLDGTILQHGAQNVDPEYFSVIKALKKKGIHFVAASGRQYYNLHELFHEVSDDISYISENGGMYVFNGEVHIPKMHSRELVKEVVTAIRQDPDCELTYSCPHTTYIELKSKRFYDHLVNTVKYNVTITEDLLALDEDTMKLAICNQKGADTCEEKYRKMFGDKLTVVTSGNLWIDFMPFGVNKGAALEHLIEDLDIKPEECIAFGDQWNDVEMLKLVGTSYAMKNAAPGIADFCTHTTDNVLKELKKLL